MRHLIETYQNGNVPSALTSINEPDDFQGIELNESSFEGCSSDAHWPICARYDDEL